MSSNIQKFQFGAQPVRVIERDGLPWWVASDVCDALGIAVTHRAVDRLDDDEKGRHSITTLGGPQEVLVINESGLYSLVLSSKKPQARAFKKWITAEVLPSIRKTGSYSATPALPAAPTPPNQLAQELAEQAMEKAIRATVGAPAPFLPPREKVYARGVEPQAGMPPHATGGGPVKRVQQGRCPYCAQPVWFVQLAPMSDRWVPLEVGHAESGWVELRSPHPHGPHAAGFGRVWLHHLPRCAAYWAVEAEKRREWEMEQIRAQAIADVRAEQLQEQQRARRR